MTKPPVTRATPEWARWAEREAEAEIEAEAEADVGRV
jgi:hypothetical protein